MQSFNARAVNGPEYFCRGAGNSTVRSMIARGQRSRTIYGIHFMITSN